MDAPGPPPRIVDASILVVLAVALVSGAVSLAATPDGAWLFVLHGVAGIALVVPVAWKLWRVRPRILAGVRALSGGVLASVLLTGLVLATIGTGLAWSIGVGTDRRIGAWTLLNVHIGFALLSCPVLFGHLLARFRIPERDDWEGRRTVVQYAAVVLGGVIVWRLSQALGAVTDSPRFTGSRESGGEGNDFPVTSWMLDDPDPVETADWQLHVVGRVESRLALEYGDLPEPSRQSDGETVLESSARRAVLDCTSGWYAERRWEGVRVGDLLDAAGVGEHGAWVTFHSVTGYRFGFPLPAAREMLLATHVDGDRVTHGHGFPLRLVAPDRRGFQWVKWVTGVEVRRERDLGHWIAIFASGL